MIFVYDVFGKWEQVWKPLVNAGFWFFHFPKKEIFPNPKSGMIFIFGELFFGENAGCSRMGGFAKDEEEEFQRKMRKEDDRKVF